jgi:cytochrome P450
MVKEAIQCRDTYARHALHRRYGKVVRTGPDELCFADAASIKDIYGQSSEPCLKASYFYDGFTLTGNSSVFSSTDRAGHARMRRLLSHGFSERGVLSFHDEIETMIERYLSTIMSRSSALQNANTAIELHDLTHSLFLDITSQLSFSKSFNILIDGEHAGARDIETYFNICPLFGVFPLARYLPFGPFKAARAAQPRIIHFVNSCIDDFRRRLRQGTSQVGLLRLMVEAQDTESKSSFSDDELIENAVIFIIAGSGTTATTLLYLLYEAGRRPEMQRRLEKEIRDTFPDVKAFPDFETAAKLVGWPLPRHSGTFPNPAPFASLMIQC